MLPKTQSRTGLVPTNCLSKSTNGQASALASQSKVPFATCTMHPRTRRLEKDLRNATADVCLAHCITRFETLRRLLETIMAALR